MSDKVKDLASRIENMDVKSLLLLAAQLVDANPEMALTLADRAVVRMQSTKLFGRDLLEAKR